MIFSADFRCDYLAAVEVRFPVYRWKTINITRWKLLIPDQKGTDSKSKVIPKDFVFLIYHNATNFTAYREKSVSYYIESLKSVSIQRNLEDI